MKYLKTKYIIQEYLKGGLLGSFCEGKARPYITL